MFAIYLKSGLVSSIWVQPSSRSALPQIIILTSLSKADIKTSAYDVKAEGQENMQGENETHLIQIHASLF